MLKRNRTKSLYEKALEKKNENIKKEKIYKEFDLDKTKNNIIIENQANNGIKFLNFMLDLIEKIIKMITVITLLVLLTIGATVLINPELRNSLLQLLNNINN